MPEQDYPGGLYLLLILHYVEQECLAESSAAARPRNETVEQICAYLAANYPQKFSLTDVAARFYLSPYYLSRLFRRVTGQSIVDYLNNRRIEAAQHLLETTDLNISAAEQTGFASAAHFRRVFREVMDISPLQYRKSRRNDVSTKNTPCAIRWEQAQGVFVLVRCSYGALALDSTCRDTFDELVLCTEENDQLRQDGDQRQSKDLVPGETGITVHGQLDEQGHRIFTGSADVKQRTHKVVAAPHELEQCAGHQSGHQHGDDDLVQSLERVAAVNGGSLVQITGDIAHELHQLVNEVGLSRKSTVHPDSQIERGC